MKKLLVISLAVIFLVSCGSEEEQERRVNGGIHNLRSTDQNTAKKSSKNGRNNGSLMSKSDLLELIKSIDQEKFNIHGKSMDDDKFNNIEGSLDKGLNGMLKVTDVQNFINMFKSICEIAPDDSCEKVNTLADALANIQEDKKTSMSLDDFFDEPKGMLTK
jgi:hypothetical protein